MVGIWNKLPGKVLEAGNLTTFKKYLDEHFKYYSIQIRIWCWKMGLAWGLVVAIVGADLMGRRVFFCTV